MNQLSDEQVISGLKSEYKQERENTLKQLYAQHFPVIASFISKNNGTPADAADIFQDAVIVFYENARKDQFDLRSSIRTYLYSICKNLWMNRLRAQKRQTTIDDQLDAIPIEPKSLEVLQNNERQELIIQLMETLGEDCKKVLSLYYFDRFRMKAIAGQMGFANEQVAKNKKAKCMKRLKTLILESPRLRNILK